MRKFIRAFENHNQYEAFTRTSEFVLPNVSSCENENEVHYNPYVPPHDYSQDYLTFVATESGTFKFSGNSINYSLDDGETWTSLASNTDSPTVSAGEKILWKATGLTPTSSIGIGRFCSSGNFTVEGNAMSLHYGDDFVGQTSLSGKNYAFKSLFSGCSGMTNVNNLILPATTLASNCYDGMFSGCTSMTSAENLSLPATTLTYYQCYNSMFRGCTSLTTAPVLPATKLGYMCYQNMFYNCTSLTAAPELPATTLADWCYAYMFYGCTSLTTAPELPATTLAQYCYANMFYTCTSLTTAPVLSATTLAECCYHGMFVGCTSLTTAPSILPATTLANNCYNGMFYACSSLTTAPELPATTLADSCYISMFYNCTKLNYIKAMFTTTPSTTYMIGWVTGVAASGTFVMNANASWNTGTTACGTNTYPCNWTIVDAS